MRKSGVLWILMFMVGLGLAPQARAQGDVSDRVTRLEREVEQLKRALAQGADSAQLTVLREQIEAITRELEEIRLGTDVVGPAVESEHGFGPAASKVYRVGQGVSIGGYGEVLYENFASSREDDAPSGKTDRFDALRGIVYVGYKFNDRILFNSEIEFEHANTEQAGEVSVEFAYLDYMLNDKFGLRGGMLLTPMGFLNELHEPPIFLGTKRPETERQIIPSTWRENGVGVFGEAGGLEFRAYLMTGLDAIGGGSSKAEGFEASGLREGRQNGSKSVAEDFAVTARVDYRFPRGLTIGTSTFAGNAGQNNLDSAGTEIDATTFIWEGHLQYRAHGFDIRGLFALATVDDVAQINQVRGFTGNESVGERLIGGYVQAGYDVLQSLPTSHQLIPYVRFEALNPQDDVPAGFEADPALNQTIVTIGAEWKPVPNVVLKSDYMIRSNDADTGVNQFNVALGYLF